MDTTALGAALEREGELFDEALRTNDLDVPVAACPGWTLRDLVAHVGVVQHWATGYVNGSVVRATRSNTAAGQEVRAAGDAALLSWYRAGFADLVVALASAGPDLDCWTFFADDPPYHFWTRRQAHELAIHRVDAQDAAGISRSSFGVEFAADGIDELLDGFGSRVVGELRADPPRLLAFTATDAARTWRARFTPNGGTFADDSIDRDEPDLEIRLPAAELYLLLWNRVTAVQPTTDGDASLIALWSRSFRI